MENRLKIMSVVGTRPEAIKMIPLIKKMAKDPEIDSVFINTGQHKEQLDQVLTLFDVKSDYNLKVMDGNPDLPTILSTILIKLSNILESEKPDLVLVHGDTATTLAGAQAAFFKQIPVAHVEAGLRTYNKTSPFPEELNRQVVARYADYHFAATQINRNNLLSEKINSENIFTVGNTVIDSLLSVVNLNRPLDQRVEKIIQNSYKTILLTTHRRENLHLLKNVYAAVNDIVNKHSDVQIVFPVHLNPAVRKQVDESLVQNERIHILDPQDYYSFTKLMESCEFIITDSGGIQEEAPSLNKPVLVARKSTERVEGVKAGTLKLVGTEAKLIYEESDRLLLDDEYYKSFATRENPYGDGRSSEKIISILKNIF